ncbi:MAG: hypothetical protein CMF31_05110 [Kordiimonas sp.]|nr:hypothetical protein [Kordiimonas sp.]
MNEFSVTRPVKKRQRQRFFNGETAFAAISEWDKNLEVFGFTKGQFSMVDLLEAVLQKTGPADVVISTWTAASADLSRVESFINKGRMSSALWLVDHSFKSRQPVFCQQLQDTFGADCIRTIATHAKFVLLKNSDWSVVMQTSMNLNQNKRIENFCIADDKELYALFDGLVRDIFDLQPAGVGFDGNGSRRARELDELGTAEKGDFYDVIPAAALLS